MKASTLFVLLIAAGLIMMAASMGHWAGRTYSCPTPVFAGAIVGAAQWPQGYQDEFMGSCYVTSGGQHDHCRCVLNQAMVDYPSAEVYTNTIRKAGGLTDDMLKTTQKCKEEREE